MTKQIVILIALLLCSILPAHSQNYDKITYVHSDADGSPFAATDELGNLEWQIDNYPYGKEYSNSQVARKSQISYAGKPYDEEIGLSYFGARWYDPDIGRFTGIDPAPVDPNDHRSFNRYSYGFNNPYKYVDPDGNFAFLVAAFAAVSTFYTTQSAINAYNNNTSVFDEGISPSGAKAAAKSLAFNASLSLGIGGGALIAKPLLSNATKRVGRGQQLGNSIKTDGSTAASEIKAKAESLGFSPFQSPNGPLKFVDENGVARATIKKGSERAPGSVNPHVELKTSSGQRVNPAGESVTRKSLGNHTPIKNDL